MGRSIGVAFECDRGYRNDGALGKPFFQLVIFGLAFNQSEPPTIVVDHDGDVIRIVKGCRRTSKRGLIERPFRRCELPNELRKVTAVFVVAGPAAFRSKIVLVPPQELRAWRQRHLSSLLVADEITADSDESLAAFRPQCRDDVRGSRTPIKPPRIAFPIWRASIKAMMSNATTDCWPLRNVSPERKRVVP